MQIQPWFRFCCSCSYRCTISSMGCFALMWLMLVLWNNLKALHTQTHKLVVNKYFFLDSKIDAFALNCFLLSLPCLFSRLTFKDRMILKNVITKAFIALRAQNYTLKTWRFCFTKLLETANNNGKKWFAFVTWFNIGDSLFSKQHCTVSHYLIMYCKIWEIGCNLCIMMFVCEFWFYSL